VFANDPTLDVVCGALHATAHDTDHFHVPVFTPSTSYSLGHPNLVKLWPWGLGVGANLSIRHSAYVALGGFDRRLGAGTSQASSEDAHFVYRAVRDRRGVRIDAENVVIHWGARSVDDGAATRLLDGSWRGVGACSGILLTAGDLFALLPLARILGSLVLGAILAAAHGAPMPQPHLARSLLSGFVHGLRLTRSPNAG
jgi:hypothetical protein